MFAARKLRRRANQVGYWFHSVDLGQGVVTKGRKPADLLAQELANIDLPRSLEGKSVLDIGGWDGYFAFEAERRGAARVAVLDHFVWSMDLPGMLAHRKGCVKEGKELPLYQETEYWHPESLPGKAGFDTARELRGSRVEGIVGDFAEMDLEPLGRWDIVLFLGVLYHLPDPFGALKRLSALTSELAVIETEALVVPAQEDVPLWRFIPGSELNNDASNWWVPNLAGLRGALRAAGFSQIIVKGGPPAELLEAPGGPHHYRATVHALK